MAELGSYVKKIRLEKGLSIRKVAESGVAVIGGCFEYSV